MNLESTLKKHRQNNPFRPRSVIGALYCEDFSDLTCKQIAEVFDVDISTVYSAIRRIRKITGYKVPVVWNPGEA